MRDELIADLKALKTELTEAYAEVYLAAHNVLEAKDGLQVREDTLIQTGAIDGKNAEIRAAQMRGLTIIERQELADAEDYLKNAELNLKKLQVRLQINLALVELIKGAA